ncbi:MAG: STAS domain-containing protein [Desulfobacterales bacterium]|nr:STAS domain-containing protein [Desulfobacterales bacterium]
MKPALFETTVLLGVPIDNLGLDEAVDRIFSMVDAHARDGRPRLAMAVDADTIIRLNAKPNARTGQSRDWINAMRHSDLIMPMGRATAWAARSMGTRLKPPFSGDQWFDKFLRLAEKKQKSLFLVGRSSQEVNAAADLVRPAYPDIRLAGWVAFDSRRDPKPDNSHESGLLDKINSSYADLLLIDLQDPRAGSWLARHRHRLNIPVTLAFTGSRQITSAIANHLQGRGKNLSLVFYSLWHHFLHTPVVFGFKILPIVFYQQYQHLAHKLFHARPPAFSVKASMSRSPQGTILKIIVLPDPLDASVIGEIKDELKSMIRQAPKVVLDLSDVYFMDSSGLGLLLALWRTAAAENRQMFLVGIRPPVYRFFKISRTLDFFEKSILPDPDAVIDLLSRNSRDSSFYYLAVIRGSAAVFHLYGQLDAHRAADMDMESVIETIGDRNAILNLAGLKFIDSAGMHLFIQIQRHAARNGRTCIFCGLQPQVQQMFEILRLDKLFSVTKDVSAAEKVLSDNI